MNTKNQRKSLLHVLKQRIWRFQRVKLSILYQYINGHPAAETE